MNKKVKIAGVVVFILLVVIGIGLLVNRSQGSDNSNDQANSSSSESPSSSLYSSSKVDDSLAEETSIPADDDNSIQSAEITSPDNSKSFVIADRGAGRVAEITDEASGDSQVITIPVEYVLQLEWFDNQKVILTAGQIVAPDLEPGSAPVLKITGENKGIYLYDTATDNLTTVYTEEGDTGAFSAIARNGFVIVSNNSKLDKFDSEGQFIETILEQETGTIITFNNQPEGGDQSLLSVSILGPAGEFELKEIQI